MNWPPSKTTTMPRRKFGQPEGFKVSLGDPAWKVLPAALKKYKTTMTIDRIMLCITDLQVSAPVLRFGPWLTTPTGIRIERCLSYDEKPILQFQKKAARKASETPPSGQ